MGLVLLSGPIAVGKTTLADVLISKFGFQRLKSSDYLKSVAADRGLSESREALQELGDELDHKTDYRWLVDDVAVPQLSAGDAKGHWLVDSVRKERQVYHFRETFGSVLLHVHIWAPEAVLRAQYAARRASGFHSEGSTMYDRAVQHPNEAASRALKNVADIAMNVDHIPASTAAAAIVTLLGRAQ